MVVMERESVWPRLGHRLRVSLRKLGRFRTPVLVVAAALFGAAISATILVGFWDKAARDRKLAQARVDASKEQAAPLSAANAPLRKQRNGSRVNSARLELGAARMRDAAQALLSQNAALVANADRLHSRGGTLETRAASVSKLAGTLGNDLVAVLHYITNTNSGSLDPSYLKAQLDYLRPAVENIRAAADTLGGEAGTYGAAVDRFTAEAAAYAEALRKLARERDRR